MALTADPEATPQHPTGAAGKEHPGSFRPDVQGLRAIAVSMVVIYHLYPKLLPGGFTGVDVFFVISGFLITGHLARGYARSGRVRLLDFWGRRARRLLPAAALVLAVTWVVSRLVLPATRLPATAEQIRGSALYYQNWILARDAVDYLTSADSPSPVQHFWSLSVEEQFYLFWPFLFVIAALVGLRGHRRRARATAFGLAAVVVVASLVYSSRLTGSDPAAAYFITTTRVWELGLGGLLSLLAAPVLQRLATQAWLGWLGLAMVIASAFVISGTSPFPGTIALLPVGGAVLLIAGGSSAARSGPWRLTSVRPMVFLGDISYSLYLWHWPVIVLWKNYSGGSIGYLDGPAIIIASIVLAWLTKVLVEDKVRTARLVTSHTGWSLATALTVLVPVLLAGLYTAPKAFSGHLDAKHPGAAAIAEHLTNVPTAPALPTAAAAPNDYMQFAQCQTPVSGTKPRPCLLGDTTHPKLTIAVIGDSVAGQWTGPIIAMAKQRHWRVVTDLHGECPWTATMTARYQKGNEPYTNCHTWGQLVLHDMLTKYKPNVLIASSRPVIGVPGHAAADATSFGKIAQGAVTYWKQLAAQGTKIIAINEAPEPHINVPDCLSKPGATPASCTATTKVAVLHHTAMQQAVVLMGGAAKLVDMNPLICTAGKCPPVVGNVTVYRDTHHLTRTYIDTLAPYLDQKLLATKDFGTA